MKSTLWMFITFNYRVKEDISWNISSIISLQTVLCSYQVCQPAGVTGSQQIHWPHMPLNKERLDKFSWSWWWNFLSSDWFNNFHCIKDLESLFKGIWFKHLRQAVNYHRKCIEVNKNVFSSSFTMANHCFIDKTKWVFQGYQRILLL